MKYIKGFDGLRAISILMVLTTHLGWLDHVPGNAVTNTRIQQMLSGGTGVNIFFVLSGFLITRILLREKLATGKISFKNFFARRFLRLLPPLLLFFSILIILMILGLITIPAIGLFFSMFYIYNFIPNRYYSNELAHTWSLGVEEQFYLFWPFVISGFKKYIVYFAATIIVLCIVANIYLPLMSVTHNGKVYLLNSFSKVNRWFIPAVAPIMVGALFSYILISNEEKLRSLFVNKFPLLVLGVLLFLIPVYAPAIVFTYWYVFGLFWLSGISVVLLWIFYNQDSLLSKILEFRPVSYIGKISYGLYVYHGLFIRNGPGSSLFIQQYPGNVFLTFGLAILSYEFYEKRVLKLKKRFA